eukprot:Selendium_serpulae@DN94_c0_g1_i1.p1
MSDAPKFITTSHGAPVDDTRNSLTVGPNGPIGLMDFALIDKLAHFDRERIPERVVHAKGAGAHGYFEVTHDVTKYCKAKLFSRVGKRTPAFCRFSTVGGEKGSADTARDPRGMAIKFYTEEGNWDMVGNNTPVFFIRDPTNFPDFIHTQKRNPATNCPEPDMFWDYLSMTPESCHQVTILFSDRGTPDGYRFLNGYSSHAFKFVNDKGEVHYVQMHFKTNQGIRNLTADRAQKLAGSDPDYATRDLYNAIAKNDPPSWTMFIQVMPESDALTYRYNVLDVTKVWPHADYPLVPVGTLTLNRNPENYFAETEQVAFAPSHLVPGIEPSEDKMLQGRLFSYPDTHRHRLGTNYDQIPINNAHMAPKFNYNHRDGSMVVDGNKGGLPNYFPNSVPLGPKFYRPSPHHAESKPMYSGKLERHLSQSQHRNDDFEQAGVLYRKVMTETDREHLISNLVGHLKNARRDVQIFGRCDVDYGRRLAKGLGLSAAELNASRG